MGEEKKSWGHKVLRRTQEKHEDKTSNQIFFENLCDIFAQEFFKREPAKVRRSPNEAQKDRIFPTAIMIMAPQEQGGAGIFQKGELKGRQTKTGWETIPIKNLLKFIISASSLISSRKISKDYIESSCIRLRIEIARFSSMLRLKGMGGARVEKDLAKLDEIGEKLIGHARTRVDKAPPKVDVVGELLKLFREHLPPKTPDTITTNRISEMLKPFGIEVKPKTIIQRLYREKKKESKSEFRSENE